MKHGDESQPLVKRSLQWKIAKQLHFTHINGTNPCLDWVKSNNIDGIDWKQNECECQSGWQYQWKSDAKNFNENVKCNAKLLFEKFKVLYTDIFFLSIHDPSTCICCQRSYGLFHRWRCVIHCSCVKLVCFPSEIEKLQLEMFRIDVIWEISAQNETNKFHTIVHYSFNYF